MIYWIQDILDVYCNCLFAFSKVIIFNRNRASDLAKFPYRISLPICFNDFKLPCAQQKLSSHQICAMNLNQCNWFLNALVDKHRGKLYSLPT